MDRLYADKLQLNGYAFAPAAVETAATITADEIHFDVITHVHPRLLSGSV